MSIARNTAIANSRNALRLGFPFCSVANSHLFKETFNVALFLIGHLPYSRFCASTVPPAQVVLLYDL
jgi:hypothetical protein